ncbi:MAG: hypothetical protein ABI356_06895 [Steroidobacteraceae bacterium]
MQIRDRAKDLIKTGGEWISSIDLEGVAMSHPAVAMAAVVGVRPPKWEERPLLFIVRKSDQPLEGNEILAFLAERVAKWWVPDAAIFLDALPVGGTGKAETDRLVLEKVGHSQRAGLIGDQVMHIHGAGRQVRGPGKVERQQKDG